MANVPFTIATYNTEKISEAGGNSDRVKNVYSALISIFQTGYSENP
jgi:hypothetical protein